MSISGLPGDRVLVANEDGETLRRLGAALEFAGLRAQRAHGGGEALVLAAVRTPALAVVDTRLPDMRADELVRQLHALIPGLPVIVTDSSGEPRVECAAREAGIVHFAARSESPEGLIPVIVRLLVWSQRGTRAARADRTSA
jgi:DNA-binding NtrC family response regulator